MDTKHKLSTIWLAHLNRDLVIVCSNVYVQFDVNGRIFH
jgi:hypothetical protein